MRAKCKCYSCGETLTAPIFFEGKIYGFSCIKKVNPNYTKGKKTYYVEAESFKLKRCDNGNTSIVAIYKNTIFHDLIVVKRMSSGELTEVSWDIKIIEDKAYINLLKYKKGIF